MWVTTMSDHDHPDTDLTDPHGEAEALRRENARLRAELASGSFYKEADIDALMARAEAAEAAMRNEGRRQAAEESDYDAGYLNDFGGGNVSWWHDYLRAEIARANDHWRAILAALEPEGGE